MGVRRPELVLAAALVVSLPALASVLGGGISVASGLLRFALALALCWAGGSVIERVHDAYSRQARQEQIRKAIEEARTRFGQTGEDDTSSSVFGR
jgi:hypothetical protein